MQQTLAVIRARPTVTKSLLRHWRDKLKDWGPLHPIKWPGDARKQKLRYNIEHFYFLDKISEHSKSHLRTRPYLWVAPGLSGAWPGGGPVPGLCPPIPGSIVTWGKVWPCPAWAPLSAHAWAQRAARRRRGRLTCCLAASRPVTVPPP